MTLDRLISDAYREEQRQLHAAPRGYGGRGDKWAPTVLQLATQYRIATILDYGCGQGSLARAVRPAGWPVAEYDPARPGLDALPAPADLVVCTDVLEHIEPDKIGAVLWHLTSLATRALFVVISLVETNKRLSDGRQAHILLRPPHWWRAGFEGRGFELAREVPGRHKKKRHKEWAAVLVRRSA